MTATTARTSFFGVPALLSATLTVSAVALAANPAKAIEASGASRPDLNLVSTSVEPLKLEATSKTPTAIAQNTEQNTEQTPSLQQVNVYSAEGQGNAIDQVTSVSQLSDVRPTDWAFQALQSLVERYGCIAGYPDRTYRGNRALTRYEFAAGLNACLDRVNELIAASTADLVRKEDLATLQKLQEEFAAEVATLRGQVDALEARTTTLERQQFSTTTKLRGEAIFAIADTFGDRAGDTEDRTNTIFSNRIRLNLESSFTGRDRLRVQLEGANTPSFSGAFTGTNMTRLGFDGGSNNAVSISELYYRFPIGENLRVQIDATRNEFYDGLVDPISPLASSGSGALSRFGRFNPVIRSGASGAGLTFDLKLSEALSFQGGYIADTNSNDPGAKNGLFNGAYSALGQVVFRPASALTLGLTYVRSFYPGGEVNLTSSTGSAFAASPFGGVATSADSFAGSVQFRLSPRLLLGGWFGATLADQRSGGGSEATILNGAVYAAFPDLGREGNLGAILVGVPPKVTRNDVAAREDPDTSLHVEALYRIRVNDNIAITPGVFVIFDPQHNNANSTQYVGTIRTTFTF
ncbi:iron uptake porin [Myxacorys almedinensis]|uniref:Iron uptake porin n=1 Tax=Myxacorys almedinensis A TaxID=2690445 RepID=A0A8J8CH28_9CYAN|nr:iron uptake porin [Myxacorys almedinensis]NDJ16338.1 iron uptake porin [Myxacorys almedinensis A]